MRPVGNHPADDVPDLREFIHEVDAVVQTAGRVDQDHVGPLRDGGLHGVEGHGSGVGAHRLLDDVHPGALRPDGELLHGRSAESVGSADHDFLALRGEHRREFTDGGGLPHPVHAHHEHDIGLLREIEGLHGSVVAIDIQEFSDLVADEVHEFVHGHILVPFHPVLQVLDDLEGGVHAHVGGQQSLLQRIQHVIVHLGLAHDSPSQLLEEVQVRLPESLVENTHLPLFLITYKYKHFTATKKVVRHQGEPLDLSACGSGITSR